MGEPKVAVFTPVKLENRYIREFVEYYQKLGFTNIILADNNDLEGEKLEEVIGDCIESGFVKVENYRGQRPSRTLQNTINQELWNKYNWRYDWVGIFDTDEYLELDSKYKTISDFLNLDRFRNVDEIRLNCKIYGDGGQLEVINDNYGLMSRFYTDINISRDTYRQSFTKALLRGKKQIDFNLIDGMCSHHGANIGGISLDVDVYGNPVNHASPSHSPLIFQEAWINHFYSKTFQEALLTRRKRGQMNSSTPIPVIQWYQNINPQWTLEDLYNKSKEWE